MDDAINIWIITGIISAMSGMLWWAFRTSVQALVGRLDALVEEVRKLTQEVVLHNHRLDALDDKNKEIRQRINAHAERLRHLEIKS